MTCQQQCFSVKRWLGGGHKSISSWPLNFLCCFVILGYSIIFCFDIWTVPNPLRFCFIYLFFFLLFFYLSIEEMCFSKRIYVLNIAIAITVSPASSSLISVVFQYIIWWIPFVLAFIRSVHFIWRYERKYRKSLMEQFSISVHVKFDLNIYFRDVYFSFFRWAWNRCFPCLFLLLLHFLSCSLLSFQLNYLCTSCFAAVVQSLYFHGFENRKRVLLVEMTRMENTFGDDGKQKLLTGILVPNENSISFYTKNCLRRFDLWVIGQDQDQV